MTFLKRLLDLFWCQHQWKLIATVKDQNLRSGGYSHWSEVYQCQKCGRHETRELS